MVEVNYRVSHFPPLWGSSSSQGVGYKAGAEEVRTPANIWSCCGHRMRVLTFLWIFGFLLKEAQAWGFKNGIFHNSIWLGKYHAFCSVKDKMMPE